MKKRNDYVSNLVTEFSNDLVDSIFPLPQHLLPDILLIGWLPKHRKP